MTTTATAAEDAKVCVVCSVRFRRGGQSRVRWATRTTCSLACTIAKNREGQPRDQRLLDGELLIKSWCIDCAPCGCPATHLNHKTAIPCLSVADHPASKTTRCLSCNATWRTFEFRWQMPTELLSGPTTRAA